MPDGLDLRDAVLDEFARRDRVANDARAAFFAPAARLKQRVLAELPAVGQRFAGHEDAEQHAPYVAVVAALLRPPPLDLRVKLGLVGNAHRPPPDAAVCGERVADE